MTNIIIGSRALQEYTVLSRPALDIDLILDDMGLSELQGYTLKASGFPGKFVARGQHRLEISRFGKRFHHLLLNQIDHYIDILGIRVAVPTLSALRSVKKGTVAGGGQDKSIADLAFIDTLDGWYEDEKTEELFNEVIRDVRSFAKMK